MSESSYPQWIEAQDGTMLHLALITTLCIDEDGTSIMAETGDRLLQLACFADEDQCQAGYRKLVEMLPIAVLSMDLDIVGPVEREGTVRK